MKNRKIVMRVTVLILFLAMLCLSGCFGTQNRSPISNTYSTFETAEICYFEGLGVANDLYNKELITKEQKDKIVKVGEQFRAAHDAAAIAFETWVEKPTFDNKEKMDRLRGNMDKLEADFRGLIYGQ